MMDAPICPLNPPVQGRVAARWLTLSALVPMLGACAAQPTLPDPSILMAPTKEIIVMEGHLDAPHQVLGSVDAILGGLHESDLPRAVDAAKQHLRSAAYTKYGERLDAIVEVRTSPVTPRGLFGRWFGRTRGLQAEGVAVAVSLPPADVTEERSLQEAADATTSAIVGQLLKLPSFLGSVDKHGIVIDPILEAPSGQQTAATYLLEQQVADRLRSVARLQVLPFHLSMLTKTEYLLTATMKQDAGTAPGAQSAFQINLAIVDMKTGTVLARASSRTRDDSLDTDLTPYYRDSPIVVKDKVVDGYLSTAETPPGQAADSVYFERVATATLISEALLAYNAERYHDALSLYRNAAATPSGDQLRVVNGIYLATWKLGQVKEAEEAFGNVVAFGLRSHNLGVKFLFKPGTTDFWSDPRVSGAYGLWLRQIARQVVAEKVCLNVVGHASRTGSEQFNDRLSQQRATYIKGRLEAEAPELMSRLGATGMGYRENIVGLGTDDARDALDRRVEFKVAGCYPERRVSYSTFGRAARPHPRSSQKTDKLDFDRRGGDPIA
jgi:outer membrane protein OmpA-like peptidoglycan-associated protein